MIPPPTSYLSPRDAHQVVARALCRQLWLKLGVRDLSAVPDPTALRALPSEALDDKESLAPELCYVTSATCSYWWDRYSTAADNGTTVIQPADVVAGRGGRWLAAPFRDFTQRFYLRGVALVHDSVPLEVGQDSARPSLTTLCANKTPFLFVCFTGKDAPQETDAQPIAEERRHLDFRLKVVSQNWRHEATTQMGSPLADERAADPGPATIIGDIEEYLMRYNTLHDFDPGMGRVKIGQHRAAQAWGRDNRLMDTLDIRVLVSIQIENEIQDLGNPAWLAVQLQQSGRKVGDKVKVGLR